MQPETEQIFATLELLLEQNLPFNLPGHEDGGRIFPFGRVEGEYYLPPLSVKSGRETFASSSFRFN